jgi:hypothetical protein
MALCNCTPVVVLVFNTWFSKNSLDIPRHATQFKMPFYPILTDLLRLGAQSVTLLSTLRDPTQLIRR